MINPFLFYCRKPPDLVCRRNRLLQGIPSWKLNNPLHLFDNLHTSRYRACHPAIHSKFAKLTKTLIMSIEPHDARLWVCFQSLIRRNPGWVAYHVSWVFQRDIRLTEYCGALGRVEFYSSVLKHTLCSRQKRWFRSGNTKPSAPPGMGNVLHAWRLHRMKKEARYNSWNPHNFLYIPQKQHWVYIIFPFCIIIIRNFWCLYFKQIVLVLFILTWLRIVTKTWCVSTFHKTRAAAAVGNFLGRNEIRDLHDGALRTCRTCPVFRHRQCELAYEHFFLTPIKCGRGEHANPTQW